MEGRVRLRSPLDMQGGRRDHAVSLTRPRNEPLVGGLHVDIKEAPDTRRRQPTKRLMSRAQCIAWTGVDIARCLPPGASERAEPGALSPLDPCLERRGGAACEVSGGDDSRERPPRRGRSRRLGRWRSEGDYPPPTPLVGDTVPPRLELPRSLAQGPRRRAVLAERR
jgi:hypothetical protein